jgi:hypothetical protein
MRRGLLTGAGPRQFRDLPASRGIIELLLAIDCHTFDGQLPCFALRVGKHPIPSLPLRRYLLLMDFVPEVAYYLAEWYLQELTEQSVDDVVAKLDAAAISVSDEGTPVRLVVTLAVPTDEVLYGVFGAQSPDIVTTTCQRAGVPHQRLSAHVGTRIREEPLATMLGKSWTGSSVEPEPTSQ